VPIVIPDVLAGYLIKHEGDAGRAWIAGLPRLVADCLDRWRLRVVGEPMHGMSALVVPVVDGDDVPAALKLQVVTEESVGEPAALNEWNGNGAVRLLDHDPASGAMLLERLDSTRSLMSLEDDLVALRILSELLVRLVSVQAPDGMRHLKDIAADMLERVPRASVVLPDAADRRLLEICAGTVGELLGDAGDRLLHWDLHQDNVLAAPASSGREPWLAIDPKPLAGDPGFELLPALWNRWADIVATGDVARAVRRRFDLMTEVLGLDRERATGWTLGRVLQDALWEIEDGVTTLESARAEIARALIDAP
jgi:streptomycin 6-kinase